jgi:hypothetical protein
MRRWLNKHWLYVIAFGVGLILTPVAIRSAYTARGYFAIGGEYLVLPLALLVAGLINEAKTIKKTLKKAPLTKNITD